MLFTLLAVALFAGFYYLLYTKKVPVLVMQIWFILHLFIGCSVNATICFILRKLAENNVMRVSLSQCICRVTSVYTFSWSRLMCPYIYVQEMPGSMDWSTISGQNVMCLSHASFFDTVLYLWMVPSKYIWRAKTFTKSTLRNLPILNQIILGCGQFPVYFTSNEGNSFSVSKDLQSKVAADVEAFVTGSEEGGNGALRDGGSLSFFVEGAMNRTPETLQSFRLGSFNTTLAHRLPLYYVVFHGTHLVWPPGGKGLPGSPAAIYYYIGKYDYDADKEDAKSLSEGLRTVMQKHLDDILIRRAADNAREKEATAKRVE